jgi:hypothetical protein
MDMIEQIGALLGLAAFLGLAVLVLLYFQQARDVRRLREWAGRAPERAEAAAEEAIAAATKEAGLEPEEDAAAPGPQATLRERLAARLRLPANLRERLPAIPYLAIIAVGVVLVAVGVGVATGGFGLLGDEEADGGKREVPLPPGKVEVAVLNGTAAPGTTGVPGLADEVAREVKSDGFKVGAVGDVEGAADTFAMYQPGNEAQARQVADELSKELSGIKLQQMTGEVRAVAEDADVAIVIGLNNSQLE